jgi:hypothetical protein
MRAKCELSPIGSDEMSYEANGKNPANSEINVRPHQAQGFEHPDDVVRNPNLTLEEKRIVLASWASDACAVEAAPALRRVPGTGHIVSVDEILEALRILDRKAGENGSSWVRRQVRRASIEAFRARRADESNARLCFSFGSGSAKQEASS